jgi:hypothetical protein
MITFSLNSINQDKLDWLYANVGHGGRWLYNKITDRVEPEDGDNWGYYFDGPSWYKICFLDEKKAILYSLRWA